MISPGAAVQENPSSRENPSRNGLPVAFSILLQLLLGLFLGHAYDMRIFMASGFLVASGQNPYIAQDLSSVFHNPTFQAITTVGYPPPWPLLTGLTYLLSYHLYPNLLLYNLALKLPIIAANIFLAFQVAALLKRLEVEEGKIRKAWLFMLFNPFILYVSAAWGQIDSIVAVCSLLSLLFLWERKLTRSAVMLALAIAFKPTAISLVPVIFVDLLGRPLRSMIRYFATFLIPSIIFWAGPFALFGWDPTFVLQHWNAQFSVGGGLSFMAFLELFTSSYQLPGLWWLVGMMWLPALGIAALRLKPGEKGLLELLKSSTAMVLVFFLSRAWLSETNLLLLLPLLVILTSAGELDKKLLTVLWVLPMIFSFFNTSTFQLLFPSLPALMDRLMQWSDSFREARLVIRILVVIPWLILGWRLVVRLLKQPSQVGKISALAED